MADPKALTLDMERLYYPKWWLKLVGFWSAYDFPPAASVPFHADDDDGGGGGGGNTNDDSATADEAALGPGGTAPPSSSSAAWLASAATYALVAAASACAGFLAATKQPSSSSAAAAAAPGGLAVELGAMGRRAGARRGYGAIPDGGGVPGSHPVHIQVGV